jgi:hypothetical protein
MGSNSGVQWDKIHAYEIHAYKIHAREKGP